MPAFVIIDIEVTNPTAYEDYKKLAPDAIARYGGRYLTRGGRTEVLEGDWQPKRLVILQFESLERAKEWLDSPEYAEAKHLRHAAARTNMIVTEGL